jgi:hypothetical protein
MSEHTFWLPPRTHGKKINLSVPLGFLSVAAGGMYSNQFAVEARKWVSCFFLSHSIALGSW